MLRLLRGVPRQLSLRRSTLYAEQVTGRVLPRSLLRTATCRLYARISAEVVALNEDISSLCKKEKYTQAERLLFRRSSIPPSTYELLVKKLAKDDKPERAEMWMDKYLHEGEENAIRAKQMLIAVTTAYLRCQTSEGLEMAEKVTSVF